LLELFRNGGSDERDRTFPRLDESGRFGRREGTTRVVWVLFDSRLLRWGNLIEPGVEMSLFVTLVVFGFAACSDGLPETRSPVFSEVAVARSEPSTSTCIISVDEGIRVIVGFVFLGV
jgi:hypothetical protein